MYSLLLTPMVLVCGLKIRFFRSSSIIRARARFATSAWSFGNGFPKVNIFF